MVFDEISPNKWRLSKNEVLLKDKTGYRVIYPIKLDGKTNYTNLVLGGSWLNFGKNMLVLALIFFMVFAYIHDTKECRRLIENPPTCFGIGGSPNFKLNTSNLSYSNDFNLPIPTQDDDKAG